MVSAKILCGVFTTLGAAQGAALPASLGKRGGTQCLAPNETLSLVQTLFKDLPAISGDLVDMTGKLVSLQEPIESAALGNYDVLLQSSSLKALNGILGDITKLSNATIDMNGKIDWGCVGNDQLQKVVGEFDDISNKVSSYTQDLEKVVDDLSNMDSINSIYGVIKDLYYPNKDLLDALKDCQSRIPLVGDKLAAATSALEKLCSKVHDLLSKMTR